MMPRVTSYATGIQLNWRQILAVNLGVSCATTCLFWIFRPQLDLPGVLWIFFYCLLFSNVIGMPAAYALARWGLRPERRTFPLNWMISPLQILTYTIVGPFLALIFLRSIGFIDPDTYSSELWVSRRFAIVIGLTASLAVGVWQKKKDELESARREIQRRELDEARALRLAAEARLSWLESRLRPHFLFNTLNSIASLITENPKLADRTLQRLAAILRVSLEANQEKSVTLAQECKLVSDYLEIEKARFGERLRYAIDVDPGIDSLEVPPFALQTLVENSVKHAVTVRREGAEVSVTARVEDGELKILVRDSGPGFTLDDLKAGHGLDSLQERLANLFGERGSLNFYRSSRNEMCVQLRLPAGADRAKIQ